ncbi:hypothetical protein ACH42_09295 [Endozoicomonas sp. (ex Bugula neritina AB1)]|nr:hypothetical protein ACH42_09295 [Endozoicomonas sp. (ex Bugula neritina AB1)]
MTLQIISAIPDKPMEWSFSFKPMVFDIDPDSGQWYVIATWNTNYGPWRASQLGIQHLKVTMWNSSMRVANGYLTPYR